MTIDFSHSPFIMGADYSALIRVLGIYSLYSIYSPTAPCSYKHMTYFNHYYWHLSKIIGLKVSDVMD